MTRRDIIDTERRTPTENARTFMLSVCGTFTATMVVCMAFGTVFADEGARQGILYCWSVLGACVCAAGLQFVFFTPALIKRMAYPVRLFVFGVCLYAVLVAFAVKMAWFPVGMLGAWVSFTLIYLVMLAATTMIFAAKHRREERRLNEGLADYRKAND